MMGFGISEWGQRRRTRKQGERRGGAHGPILPRSIRPLVALPPLRDAAQIDGPDDDPDEVLQLQAPPPETAALIDGSGGT